MSEKSKKVGEVFSDYKTNSNIEDAEIARMNLLKKINTLEIEKIAPCIPAGIPITSTFFKSSFSICNLCGLN